ncbi:MAG: DNA-binding domain-containing protein, partial [Planctomycetota bacterium]|nr:DNA-binding domain-containing protein [Planctomycetota bacterium]
MSDREGTGEAARTPPPELDVVQRWFQSVISHPGGVDAGVEGDEAQRLIPIGRGDLERIVMRSEKLDARERMNVYANAYYSRLLECVGECFPVLKHTLGGAAFDKLAFAYLEAYPSRSYTLNHIADHFVRFLDETRPDRDRETGDVEGGDVEGGGWPDLLIDLARLEWTIGDVFDGPGSERSGTLQPADLESISADDWPRCRLELVPCLRLLEFRYPVNEYYTGVRKALARRAEEA